MKRPKTRIDSGTRLDVHIRWLIRRDNPEVMEILQQTSEYPWTEEELLAHLRQRSCIGMIAEYGEKVVGMMVYDLLRHRLHATQFAVHPAFQGMDVGTQLVEKLVSKLSSHRRTRVTAVLRETNLPAQKFARAVGFKAVKVLRGYCDDSGEDGYLFQYGPVAGAFDSEREVRVEDEA